MEEVFVNIGEIKVLTQEGRLVAVGLGSCVGLILYDALAKVGVAHVFLPTNRKEGTIRTQANSQTPQLPRWWSR